MANDPEQDLARHIILDAIKHGHWEFLTGAGDYAEISEFWFQVAGINIFSMEQCEKFITNMSRHNKPLLI